MESTERASLCNDKFRQETLGATPAGKVDLSAEILHP